MKKQVEQFYKTIEHQLDCYGIIDPSKLNLKDAENKKEWNNLRKILQPFAIFDGGHPMKIIYFTTVDYLYQYLADMNFEKTHWDRACALYPDFLDLLKKKKEMYRIQNLIHFTTIEN